MYISNIRPYNTKVPIKLIASSDKILISSVILETFSSALLKKTKVNKIWFIPIYSGYAISFYIFPKCLDKYSLSSAYSIWCISGIILTTAIDRIIYKELITYRNLLSILIMIIGIIIQK